MAQIFMASIMQKLVIATTHSNSLQNLAYGTALSKLRDRKEGLVEKFYEHGVTKEILAGPTASSSYLRVGNLNSFIGFYDGEAKEHVDKIEEIFNREIKVIKGAVKVDRTRNSVTFGFEVESPSLERIWSVTPYPQGKENVSREGSWAEDLEARGISGFEFYIYQGNITSRNSRSQEATQVSSKGGGERTPIRNETMKAVPYIERLIRNFVKSMK